MRSEVLLNHEDTELRLGLPGTSLQAKPDKQQIAAQGSNKRLSRDSSSMDSNSDMASHPSPKTQAVGWPPVRSCRRNGLQAKKWEEGMYVKVSMDGAPYLRKIDVKLYSGYQQLLRALEEMFEFKAGSYSDKEGYIRGSEFQPAYEDKDGDWMLVGDVPWEMFISSCKRLRIMKGSGN